LTPLPINAVSSEWSLGALDPAVGAAGAAPAGAVPGGGTFAKALESLTQQQDQAAGAARELASGTATDPSQAVLAVERARLSMQLAAQVRTKVVDAVNEIFHTQV
jgi:flagellar hook-basal body complex protein FliE